MAVNETVNFLPWRRIRLLRCLRYWGIWVGAIWLVCGVAASLVRGHWQGVARVHEVQTLAEQHITQRLAEQMQQLNARARQQAQWRLRQARRQKTQDWSSRLTQLAQQLPAHAWLTALSYRDGVLSLSGTLTQFSALATLDGSFQSVPGFLPGHAEKIQRDSAGRWTFEYRIREETRHEAP